MPIHFPHGLARLAHKISYTYAYLSDSREERLIKLMDEGYSRGKRVAKSDVCYGKYIVEAMTYATFRFIAAKEVAMLLMIEQGGVLTNRHFDSNIAISIPFGMK